MIMTKTTPRPMESRFTCRYCKMTFVTERRYLAHCCKHMKKEEELKSPNGQAAWQYYQRWMREMKRLPPPAGAFLASKYFRTFINFTIFTKKVRLPCPEKFIWLMVQKKYQPTIWTHDEVYVIYLEYLDRKLGPLEQAKISIETLLDYADQHRLQVDNIFDEIPPNELIQLIRLGKLSPWLLFQSDKFKAFFAKRTSPEQKVVLESLIQPSYWFEKMKMFPEEIEKIKTYIGALHL